MTESGESSRFCEKLSRMKLFNAKSEGRWTWRSRLGGQRQRRANSRFVPPSLAECWLGLRTALAQGRNKPQTPKPKKTDPTPQNAEAGRRGDPGDRPHSGKSIPLSETVKENYLTQALLFLNPQSCSNNRCRICE